MRETKLVCDRCETSGEFGEDPDDWAQLDMDASFVLLDIDGRADLCPSCKFDLEEWFLDERGDLAKTEEMALEGMRNLNRGKQNE